MWRLSGLHRDVLLLSKPSAACIADFAVRTPLSWAPDRRGTGPSEAKLEVEVQLEVAGGSQRGAAPGFGLDAAKADAAAALEGVRVVAHLFDEEGRAVVGGPLECSLEQVQKEGCRPAGCGCHAPLVYGV
jgi:beta-galactosidase/beta-glucuronidase